MAGVASSLTQMTHSLHPVAGMALVLAALLGLMATLKLYVVRCRPHPEIVRKMLHVGMGTLTLSFPWLFAAAWPVWALAALAMAHLAAVRCVPLLQKRLGGVVDGVERRSWGEMYFPLSIALVWGMSQGDPLLFCVPILVLTLADAVSALVGVRYGQRRYAVASETKSAEGSLAFLAVAFLSVHVPLLLFSTVGRAEVLLIALTLGLLVMLLEAISWQGLDNIVIPLSTYILLRNFMKLDADALLVQLGVVVVLSATGLWMRRSTTLDESAMMGAAFVAYAGWALGGLRWLLPPALMFLLFVALSPRSSRDSRQFGIHAVACVTSSSLFWLFLYSAAGPDYYGASVLALASHMAIIGLSQLQRIVPKLPLAVAVLVAALGSWLLLFVPFLIIEGPARAAWAYFLMAPAGIILAVLGFVWLQPNLREWPTDAGRWLRQALIVGAASSLSVVAASVLVP